QAGNGSMNWNTYLGGDESEFGDNLLVFEADASGAYLSAVTASKNYPVTPGAFMTVAPGPQGNVAITKLNQSNGAMAWSTYFGTNYVPPFEDGEFGSVVFIDAAFNGDLIAFTGA